MAKRRREEKDRRGEIEEERGTRVIGSRFC